MTSLTRRGLMAAALAAVAVGPAAAEADFSGETVTVIIRSSPGGGYDEYGRLIARHIGKYLPGEPDVVAQNMPGAGGIVAANYMAEQADQDGTVIAIIDRGAAFSQRLGKPGIRYDVRDFGLLGSATSEAYTFVVDGDAPVNNLNDLMALDETVKFSTTGPGSDSWTYTELLQGFGAPIELISGYEGTAEKVLAIVRGEVMGTAGSYNSVIDAVESEGLKYIGTVGRVQGRDDIQPVREIVPEGQGSLYAVAAAPLEAGRPFVTTPNVPADRLAALQEAFRMALEDPQLREEAERAGRDIGYLGPDEMAQLYEEILAAPDDVIAKFGDE